MKQYENPQTHVSRPEDNAVSLLLQRHEAFPDIPLIAVRQDAGGYRNISSAEFLERIKGIAKGLLAFGLKPGDVVAIMARTSREWTELDFAIWYAGGVSVSIYETSSPSQIQWIAGDSGARLAVVETARHAEDVRSVKGELPDLEDIGILEDGFLDSLVARGQDISDDQLEQARSSRTMEDVATLIYTSGTTGRPKGAQITHANLVDTARSAFEYLGKAVLPAGSRSLMFLPLAHVFARLLNVTYVLAGCTVSYTADTKNLLEDLADFQPTFLLAVPRVFEKVYNSAEQKAVAGGKGRIFSMAAQTAIAYSEAQEAGKRPSMLLRARHGVFDKLVYAQLRRAMGGKIQYAISGGAPLGHRLAHFFRGIGVTVLEGYGLTETTAPVCVNPPWHVKPGTVGQPLPGGAYRIADDGEVQVKGVMVFKGYRNNDEATREAFTEDGWFRTGDLGKIDDEGYLSIIGRTKEVLVTAGGKNVSPAPLEDALRSHPLISQCIVIGDQRPFVAAIISLDAEMLPSWLKNNGQPEMSLQEAAKNDAVLAELQKAVDRANENVSRAESIRKFTVIDTDFTEDNGYLTPSMKLKRNVVVKDFSDVIEELYSGPKPTQS